MFNEHRSDDSEEEEEEEEEEDNDEELLEEKYNEEDEGGGDEKELAITTYYCWGTLCDLLSGAHKGGRGRRKEGLFSLVALGGVLDPRAAWVQEWNRIFLLVCVAGLFVDPLFFYALSISEAYLCLFVDGWFSITVTVLRCMTDALHVWNMWLQLKMAKHPYAATFAGFGDGSTSRDGNGSTGVALRYLKSRTGFFFDLFVILPLPQVSPN